MASVTAVDGTNKGLSTSEAGITTATAVIIKDLSLLCAKDVTMSAVSSIHCCGRSYVREMSLPKSVCTQIRGFLGFLGLGCCRRCREGII